MRPPGLRLGLAPLVLLCCLPGARPDPSCLSILPQDPVVAFGGGVVLNCSSMCPAYTNMGWEVSVRKVTERGPGWVSMNITNLTEWNLEPQCFVKSTAIVQKTSIHVYQFSPPEIHLGSEMEAGRQERITCNVSSRVSDSSPTDINVTLSSGGSPLSESRGSPAVGYSFVAQPTQHGQEIVCEAWLRVGPWVLRDRTTARLQVWALPHDVNVSVERPEFRVGANFTVRCSAEGNPPPELRWELPSNASVELSDRGRTVTVHVAQLAHSGTYQCLAQNRFGDSSGHVHISIVGPRSWIVAFAVLGVILVSGIAGVMWWCVRKLYLRP